MGGSIEGSTRSGGAAGERPIRPTLGLGLLSFGLGLVELIAPGRLARWLGLRGRRATALITRALGVRELVSGLGVISRRRPAPWLWARVAGDLIDLALLAAAFRKTRPRIAGAMAGVVGVTALDVYAAARATGPARARMVGPVRKAITVHVTTARAYRAWRDLGNLPAFMERVQSIAVLDPVRSRWEARGPMGRTITWVAEIVEDRENEVIRWRSVEGLGPEDLVARGEVRFRPAPGDRGTQISVEIEYLPPAGELGRLASSLSSAALEVQIDRDLRRLKQLLELGEIVHSDASVLRGRHPARPPRPAPALASAPAAGTAPGNDGRKKR